jgi:hypothetical protein
MSLQFRFIAGAAVVIYAAAQQPAFAQDLDNAAKALNQISGFANSVCLTPSFKDSSTPVELNAAGKAGLARLLKQLVDLQVDGIEKYQYPSYEDQLQKDVADALQDAAFCRENVLKNLNDKLLPKLAS